MGCFLAEKTSSCEWMGSPIFPSACPFFNAHQRNQIRTLLLLEKGLDFLLEQPSNNKKL
jgi:hypothetical protein